MSGRVYCAGPLFTAAERDEMEAIESVLAEVGFDTFLPHRDGLEFARLAPLRREGGLSPAQAAAALARAIFALDTHEVRRAEAVVVNLNGRVPDEGAMVEAGIAWALGKAVVLHKDDPRTLLGGADNPLVLGLGGFEVVGEIARLPQAVRGALAADRGSALEALGRALSAERAKSTELAEIVHLVATHAAGRARG